MISSIRISRYIRFQEQSSRVFVTPRVVTKQANDEPLKAVIKKFGFNIFCIRNNFEKNVDKHEDKHSSSALILPRIRLLFFLL